MKPLQLQQQNFLSTYRMFYYILLKNYSARIWGKTEFLYERMASYRSIAPKWSWRMTVSVCIFCKPFITIQLCNRRVMITSLLSLTIILVYISTPPPSPPTPIHFPQCFMGNILTFLLMYNIRYNMHCMVWCIGV